MVRSYSWLRAHRKLACSFVVLVLWITHVAVVFWFPPPSKTSRVSLLFGTIWSKNQTHWAEFNEYQVEIFRGCIPTTNWASQSTAPHCVIENSDLMCCHKKKQLSIWTTGHCWEALFKSVIKFLHHCLLVMTVTGMSWWFLKQKTNTFFLCHDHDFIFAAKIDIFECW